MTSPQIPTETLLKAFELMCTARHMSDIYEENAKISSKYVHATSRGHEAFQLALALQLFPQDWVAPYYRDDSILLGIGMTPYELMLQIFAKKDDPFSGGRLYYCHPSLKDDDKPKIPNQTSATGMQAIPTTGVAMGIQHIEKLGLDKEYSDKKPIAVCSLGDASVTEGEVAEALQMAALHQYPIMYFVQDNGWDISANAAETRAQNAAEYAVGFKGIETRSIDGADFFESYNTIQEVIHLMRIERRPFLIHGTVPLLGHHTSGVRREWYRDDLEEHQSRDPLPRFRNDLLTFGFTEDQLKEIEGSTRTVVEEGFEKAKNAEEPDPLDLENTTFAPTPITEEKGVRSPENGEVTLMVDCALHAVEEILRKHPESLLYGQDVGGRLGGVFREAATLAQKFGKERVFNTPIQEAYIVGSTVGMSCVGLKPIVEIQFADYIYPALNQLFTEVSRSYFLSNGKWPISNIIRVPIGAYGSGGPYHSSSIESMLINIRGLKIAYPSNGADLKGLMKSAYYDPNPVIMLEHKGLYWSKVPHTEEAKCIEPGEDYVLPFGLANIVQKADDHTIKTGESLLIVTYGMGVHWSRKAAKEFPGKIEILDLRTLAPFDEEQLMERVKVHGKVLFVSEEPLYNTFAHAIGGFISRRCFEYLDAPVEIVGAMNLPAIPLNSALEEYMIPNADKVVEKLNFLFDY